MNRTEFKKRMLSLKSYRELNPDKGYWDWRAEAFEGGGEKDKYKVSSDNNSNDGGYDSSWDSRWNVFTRWDPTMRFSPETLLFDNKIDNEGEENLYWYTYLGLGNNAPKMSDLSVTLKDLEEELKKIEDGRQPSDFFGTTKRMDLSILAMADTLMLGRISRNYNKYSEEYKNLPSKEVIDSAYVRAQNILNNPNKWIVVNGDEYIIRHNPKDEYERNPLGMLRNFGIKWIPEKNELKMQDKYDFPWYARVFGRIPLRPREMKIRGTIGFQPNRGSVILRDSTEYNSNFPEVYVSEYSDGGEIPPELYKRSNYQGSNDPVYVNPFTGKSLASGSLAPVINIEDFINFTPVSNALSVRDAYTAAQNKDILGLGLAGLGLIPFVRGIGKLGRSKVSGSYRPTPIIDRNYFDRLFEQMERATAKKRQVVDDFYKQLDKVYESIVENEDAFRKAANADATSGTNYIQTYSDLLRNYSKGSSKNNDLLPQLRLTEDMPMSTKAQVDPNRLDWISINSRYADPDELDPVFLRMNPGLIRHELGHIVDEKSNLDYIKKLGDRSKFESEERLMEMYPSSYKRIQDYLLNGSEIKSHMNEFRDFLFLQGDRTLKETPRSMRLKLDKYKDLFKNLNILFDSYKSKKQFIKDYNSVPIVQNNQRSNKSNYA